MAGGAASLSCPPCRNAIAEAMVWCIEHADCGEEIVECLAEALAIPEVTSEESECLPRHFADISSPTHLSTCFRPQQLKR